MRVLVAHRDHVQRVKEVVGELKSRGHEAYRTASHRGAPVGHVHRAGGSPRLQDQAHRRQARRRAVAATAPPPLRALGRGERSCARDARRATCSTCIRTNRRTSRPLTPAPAGKSGGRTARDDRGAVRRLPGRGRHRSLRRHLWAHGGPILIGRTHGQQRSTTRRGGEDRPARSRAGTGRGERI